MSWWFRRLLFGSLLLLSQVQAAPLPIEAFFETSTFHRAALSPGGRWLAAVVQPKGERARLVVTDLEDKEPARIVAQFSSVDVNEVWWADDEWLLFDTDDDVDVSESARYLGQGLVAVRRDGERMRIVIKQKFDSLFAPAATTQPLEPNHGYLRLGAAGTTEIVVARVQYDARWNFTNTVPFAVDFVTGRRRALIGSAPPDASRWVFDHLARPRAAVGTAGGKTRVYWLDHPEGPWRTLATFDALDVGWTPQFIDGDGNLFAAATDARGFSTLAQVDLATGRLASEPLIGTPGFNDGITMLQDRKTGALVGLDVRREARTRVWVDPAMKALQARVDATLPGRVNRILCLACASQPAVLVFSYSDRSPGDYLVFRPSEDRWQRIGRVRPAIDPATMAQMQFERIRARDGRELPMWITATPQAEPGPRPAVVLVHGGPWVRGFSWRWDPEVQFLASRGYVVIQPEFRGSQGYGVEHFRAGWKQWGQAMQDDVTDALRHAVARGLVDPQRVCIAGASYGGYGTLMGLAKDPDQYRCGVAWVGVSDPMLMYSVHWSDITRESKEHGYPKLIGDPKTDAAMLEAISPLAQAARIKAPVFLAYGRRDMRVPLEHGELMRAALRKAGNEPVWQVYDDEEHGFFRPANKIDFWTRVEAFLARHLK